MSLENSFYKNKSLIGGSIPETVEIKDAVVKEKEKPQIFKDERDANGNGYVEFFIEATPVHMNEIHNFRVGYQVTDKLGGMPGKKWQKAYEEDFGPLPKTDTVH